MKPTIEEMVREIYNISKGVSKGILEIMIPPNSKKPKWCQCNKCGQWHYRAK